MNKSRSGSQLMNSQPGCPICNQPVALGTAIIDGQGRATHLECYASKLKLEQPAPNGPAPSVRPWRMVAAELSREQDPTKMTKLIVELNQALDEQNLDGTPKLKSGGKPESDGKPMPDDQPKSGSQ